MDSSKTSGEQFDHPRVAKSISGIFVVFAGHGVTLSGGLVYNAGAHSHGSHTLESAMTPIGQIEDIHKTIR